MIARPNIAKISPQDADRVLQEILPQLTKQQMEEIEAMDLRRILSGKKELPRRDGKICYYWSQETQIKPTLDLTSNKVQLMAAYYLPSPEREMEIALQTQNHEEYWRLHGIKRKQEWREFLKEQGAEIPKILL
jgi:hypothetical protein